MEGKMAATQVVMEFARRTPADEETMDRLASATLDVLNERGRFLAFGPVVSADYERSVIEVECTLCSETPADDDIDGKIDRLAEIVHSGLAVAEYNTSSERVATSV